MPQEIETPVASPRMQYKAGDEVSLGGQTFSVVGTNQDGLPLLAPSKGFKADTPKTPAKSGSGNIFEKIYANGDKIAALPNGIRAKVIDRLFEKVYSSHIPKAMNDQQRGLLRQRFEDTIVKRPPTPDTSGPTDRDYKSVGLPRGTGGKVQEGVLKGTGNIFSLLDQFSNQLEDARLKVPGQISKHSLPEKSALTTRLLDSAEVLRQSTAGYTERHPFKAGAAELGGQILPSIPLEMAMPGAPPGAGLLPKVAAGAGKGSVSMIPFDPTPKGLATGAALGAGSPILGKGLSKVKSKIMDMITPAAGKVADKSSRSIIGAAENASQKLEELAQKNFQKPLSKLTPDQKIELVSKWRDDAVAATKLEKTAAVKAREAAKQAAVTAKATEKIDKQVAIRRAMDESKALQKQIREFVKTNKRAPTDEELTSLRAKMKEAAPVEVAKPPVEERGTKVPEKRSFMRTTKEDIKQYYSYRFDQLRNEMKGAATPEAKADVERRFNELVETQKRHPESMGDPQEFKVESPEAAKAVSAVADVSRAAEVVKVPEGQHGSGVMGQRAKDAERVAKARELAKATQPEPAAAETPETALQKKEEEFFNLAEQIEATGPKGKEAAKNLDVFRRKGTVTMDQAMEMGQKVLEILQKGVAK